MSDFCANCGYSRDGHWVNLDRCNSFETMTTRDKETTMAKFAAVGTDGTRLVVWGLGDSIEAALVDAGLQPDVDGVDLSTRVVTNEQATEIERGGVDWDAILAIVKTDNASE